MIEIVSVVKPFLKQHWSMVTW